MNDLEFTNVSKRYRVREEIGGPVAGGLLARLARLRPRYNDFWAVRDVSFAARRGEALGIIGHNGAGKSTILKLVSSITAPTTGSIRIRGRLASLIEVGSGFHPELTGRENIYLNGSILGMRRRDITANIERIIEFAGINQFIDTPVKRYSSGMYVRLGFSIAAHLDPDILLLDEVLAVGDAAFQARCLERIAQMQGEGKTIVFISHDLSAVERLCSRALLMQRGQLVTSGETRDVISEYQRSAMGTVQHAAQGGELTEVSITAVECYGAGNERGVAVTTGDPLVAKVHWAASTEVSDVVIEFLFYSADCSHLESRFTTEFSDRAIDLRPGSSSISFSCSELGLRPGIYVLGASIKRRGAHEDLDWRRNCMSLRVDPRSASEREFHMPNKWELVANEAR